MGTPAPSSPPSLNEGASAHDGSSSQVKLGLGRARAWRWLVRVLLGAAALFLLTLGALLALLLNLDRPWLKAHVCTLIRARTSLELDYQAVRLPRLGEFHIERLVVRSPVQLRKIAPALLAATRLRVEWSPSALLSAEPVLKRVHADELVLTVLLDEQGRTSFDALPKSAGAPSAPPTPPSRLAGELMSLSALMAALRVEDSALVLVRTKQAKEVERYSLRGLSFHATVVHAASEPKIELTLGRRKTPTPLTLVQQWKHGKKSASLAAFFVANVTREQVGASLDLHIAKQDFAPDLFAPDLQVAAEARFDALHSRTILEVARCQVGDGIASVSARLLLTDQSSLIVQRASADVDVARLLQLIPSWLVPLRIVRGQAHVRALDFTLGTLNANSTLSITGEVEGAQLTSGTDQQSVAGARFSLEGRPRDDALTVRGKVSLTGLRMEHAGDLIRADDVQLVIDSAESRASGITGQLRLQFATLDAPNLGIALARDGDVLMRVEKLLPVSALLRATRGDVALEGTIAQLSTVGAYPSSASNVSFSAHAPLSGTGALTMSGRVGIARLRIASPARQPLADIPLRLELQLRNARPNLQWPMRSEGSAQIALEAGALSASLQTSKANDALDFDVSAQAPGLVELIPFLPKDIVKRVPWATMGLSLHSRGRIERLSTKLRTLQQRAEVALSEPALDDMRARTLALVMQSSHSHSGLSGGVELRAQSLTVAGGSFADPRLTFTAALSYSSQQAKLRLVSPKFPAFDVRVDAAFDRAQQAVSYDLQGDFAQLAPIEPLLSEVPFFRDFELANLALQLRSNGKIRGLVAASSARDLTLSPDALRTASGELSIDAQAQHLTWSHGDSALVRTPAASWRATLQGEGAQRTVQGELWTKELEIGLGGQRVGISDLHDKTAITVTGDLLHGTIEHTQQLSLGAVRQRLFPMYTLGDLTMSLRSRRTPDGLIKIASAHIENRAGGTTADLSGGMELGVDRRRVSIRAALQQDLARLSRPERFVGKGKLTMDLLVSSPDLHLFHTRSKLQLSEASISLPAAKVALAAINGELPIVSDWTVDRKGVDLVRGAQVNPYATQRFSDQHPLLSQRSFISIAKVSTPVVTIAPFAANLTVERNILSLSQMEMGVRGGTVTGNGTLHWEGASSKVEANVRATGVKSSRGEPFDGNAALLFDAQDRSIEGRADILRIGRRHLLDLLDIQDPQRADPALNGVRSALRFGYPERVRISFKHGFASAGVSLGGLGSLLKIPEVRGLPIGPMVERALSSLRVAEEP